MRECATEKNVSYFMVNKAIMRSIPQLVIITFIFVPGLSACSKQAWYQGMQSAQTAKCMEEPVSEYDDCNQQSDEIYQDYERNRKDLNKQPSVAE